MSHKSRDYISRDSEFYAELTILRIYESPQSLINFPKRGRIAPEIGNEDIRELFVIKYRIICEIKSSKIHILNVIHGKRLLDKYQNLAIALSQPHLTMRFSIY